MYAGRMGYGAKLPYSLGEVRTIDNLGEVSRGGYGPYLGNIFDDLANIAQKVGVVSSELSKVASGESKIATIPTNKATITIPAGDSPIGVSIPLVPIMVGAGLLLYFGLRKRR